MSAPRSYLFVPANRPDRYAKALASGADAVIVDLEDAVPAGERKAARAALNEWLSPEHPVLVRVNGATTEWFKDDVALCTRPGVAGVVLPKAERAEDVSSIGHAHILPIIETARGFSNVSKIAHAANVQRLLFGSIDFQVDLGIHGEGEELLYFRSHLVLASRVAELQAPVDGVTTSFDSPELVRADTVRARRLGFGAKLCIHPKQIATVHECFGPSAQEIVWATRVLEATSKTGGEAISVDGEMIDRPVIARAEAILSHEKKRSDLR